MTLIHADRLNGLWKPSLQRQWTEYQLALDALVAERDDVADIGMDIVRRHGNLDIEPSIEGKSDTIQRRDAVKALCDDTEACMSAFRKCGKALKVFYDTVEQHQEEQGESLVRRFNWTLYNTLDWITTEGLLPSAVPTSLAWTGFVWDLATVVGVVVVVYQLFMM
ncbi:hypothetical protein CALCODRAFT_501845 [Calocera cornea HHB12733]|uniref:Uncharacterized protein n=1 Tax=Calocera cornea HHB12733 TaxID=1353952 RepID=A0A165DI00_9BASI|nr:hypothetical protein CALCODRAFT_501845 [Calocera cornea HHB12733]